MTDAVIAACLAAAQAAGAPLIVDSKARGFARYGAVDLVKPNAAELAHATGLPTGTDAEVEAALAARAGALRRRAILVTRVGARACRWRCAASRCATSPVSRRQVFDVSGAGDTALAALGLALAAGADLDEAVELALLASGVAVEKPGTATATPGRADRGRDLPPTARRPRPRSPRRERMARRGRRAGASRACKVGFTNGCFDILHRGHVAYLAQAAGLVRPADRRPQQRPLGPRAERRGPAGQRPGIPRPGAGRAWARWTWWSPSTKRPPCALIEAARPDVLIKGADYTGRRRGRPRAGPELWRRGASWPTWSTAIPPPRPSRKLATGHRA